MLSSTVIVGALVPVLLAAPQQRVPANLTPEQIFQKCAPAVVSIVTSVDGSTNERGTGTVVGPKPFIVTNAHVLNRASEIFVDSGSSALLGATLLYYDPDNDLAVLSVNAELPAALALDRSEVKVGQRVYAIGNPQGLSRSISEGIVSGLRHEAGGPLVQHTAPISPGSSGGPLLSASGHLVGINTFLITESQNLNFAVSAERIRAAMSAAASSSESLPSPAALRRQRLDPMISDAYERQDYRALADLAAEALTERLQPRYYYSALAGMAYVELGFNAQAQPLLEAAASEPGPDSPSKQTARWYLLRSLFDRFLHQNERHLKGGIARAARAFLASSEAPLHGDLVTMRKAATDTLAAFADPSGLWFDSSGALLRMFKTNTFKIRCEPSKCWVEVQQHPEAKAAGMKDITLGSGILQDDTLTGTYTIMLFLGPTIEPYATWKQDVSFRLRWSDDFDALEGTVTYRTGEAHANVPEAGAFLRNVLFPTTVSVRLIPAE